MIELTFQYTEKEYIRAIRQYLIISKVFRKWDAVVLPLFAVLAIGYAIYCGFNMLSVIILTIILVSLLMCAVIYYYAPIHAAKKSTALHEKYHFLFDDDGIQFQTKSIDSKLEWKTYQRIISNAEFYYLIQGPKAYTVIPKRVFKNKQTTMRFETLTSNHLEASFFAN